MCHVMNMYIHTLKINTDVRRNKRIKLVQKDEVFLLNCIELSILLSPNFKCIFISFKFKYMCTISVTKNRIHALLVKQLLYNYLKR